MWGNHLSRRFFTALVVRGQPPASSSWILPLCLETGSLVGLMITTKMRRAGQHVPGICLSQFPLSDITGVNQYPWTLRCGFLKIIYRYVELQSKVFQPGVSSLLKTCLSLLVFYKEEKSIIDPCFS